MRVWVAIHYARSLRHNAIIAAEHALVTVHPWDNKSISLSAGWPAISTMETARASLASEASLDRLAGIRSRV